ncbi:tyrosine-protein phosphatase [Xenophilus azovorans]|uniref:tyrosine-protein phosphatase n=1 Tax=Xenophilus azovorans TaxID=151755 RepID=UPI000571A090|nr:tyrosine-protein phosphatase [Xenophilus azovorans]
MTGVMLRGAPNFRDLGGLGTREGRFIAPGRLLRSGQLGELHAEDIEHLAAWLGADVCVIDLRGASERLRQACALPQAVVHSLPIEPSVALKLDTAIASGQDLTPAMARAFMAEAYRGFVRKAQAQATSLFAHVLDRAGRPLVVHCAAGKDRTGFMVALLLSALDVPRETILEDYLLTNQRVQPRESRRYAPEIMEVLGTVRAEFLEAAFDLIDEGFGGTARYLQQAAALTPQRRARLHEVLLSP